jgi:hypothetical protein
MILLKYWPFLRSVFQFYSKYSQENQNIKIKYMREEEFLKFVYDSKLKLELKIQKQIFKTSI